MPVAWLSAIMVIIIFAVPFVTFLGLLSLEHPPKYTCIEKNSYDKEVSDATDGKEPIDSGGETLIARIEKHKEGGNIDQSKKNSEKSEAAIEEDKESNIYHSRCKDYRHRPWYRRAESRQYRMLERFAVLSAVAAFGAFGAAVSMLTRLRKSSQTNIEITLLDVISVHVLGASFALFLCLLFIGQFIRGTLFPDPLEGGSDQWFDVIYSLEHFSKLLVWSFISGFSERIVPDFIHSLSKRFRSEA